MSIAVRQNDDVPILANGSTFSGSLRSRSRSVSEMEKLINTDTFTS